ncbi:MATE family efflux transporter [Desulfosporosinus sp. FKB]|uniref:MATE family efflux transporter n=1 Tax=Desulfosporosinus sp. FKB TaxID=1969835 RepID=UPI000B4998BA|nr:MATE family efflux transporter [Desulfosporosinus sp. FKB]
MEHSQQLGEKEIISLLLKFSIPAIVGMMVMSLYNVIDRIFVGNSAGALGIAGITICFPLQLVMIAFVLLTSIGANSLVSIKLGEGKKDEAEHILGNAFSLLIIISVIITVLGLIFLDPLLKLFGSSNEVLPYAKAYFQIILYGTVLQSLGFGLNNFIRGEGNPKVAMMTMLMGAILNAILCPILIFGFKMGIRGSALATVIAQGLSGVWVLHYFFFGKSSLKIHKKYLLPNIKVVSRIVALGSAQFAMEMATSLVNVILNKSLLYYGGDMAISGMGIVTSIQALVLMPLFGINQGAQPVIGYNYGAKKLDRVKEALKLAILGASFICILGFILVEIFPQEIVSLFNSNDARLINFTVYAMRVFLIMLPVLGFQVVGSNYFMSVGRPRPAALLSLSRQFIIFIPAVLILPLFLNLHGVIIAGPFADFTAFILTGSWLFKELIVLDKSKQC